MGEIKKVLRGNVEVLLGSLECLECGKICSILVDDRCIECNPEGFALKRNAESVLMGTLKYPYCKVCRLLDNLGVDRPLINDYHDDIIGIKKLPKRAQQILRSYLATLEGKE